MAELTPAGNPAVTGLRRSKKLSTRIDLTPMVDLGFLLITFFMYTTTLINHKTMEITMPYRDDPNSTPPSVIKKSTALTLILSSGHKIFAYEGFPDDADHAPELTLCRFSGIHNLRAIIANKNYKVGELRKNGTLLATDSTSILIKADTNSCYSDLVYTLDEMLISCVGRYTITDLTNAERTWINAYKNETNN